VARGLGVEVETLLEGTDGEVPKAAPPSAEAEKVRLGNVASEQRLADVKAEHDRLNEALAAGDINIKWYSRKVSELYASLHNAAARTSREVGEPTMQHAATKHAADPDKCGGVDTES
jgi:hypothetical protein